MAGRIQRLSTTVNRTLAKLGVRPRTVRHHALTAAMTALADVDELPGPADYVTSFHPGYVHVRRVPGFNLWILNRFGPTFLDVVTVRDAPPPPIDER